MTHLKTTVLIRRTVHRISRRRRIHSMKSLRPMPAHLFTGIIDVCWSRQKLYRRRSRIDEINGKLTKTPLMAISTTINSSTKRTRSSRGWARAPIIAGGKRQSSRWKSRVAINKNAEKIQLTLIFDQNSLISVKRQQQNDSEGLSSSVSS